MDFISKFITSLVNGGITPKSTSGIKASQRWLRMASSDDRGHKQSISYRLTVEYDFAYGYAKDFKTGLEVRFNSFKNDSSMTKGDVARIKAMLKERQASEDRQIAERHAKIAVRAKKIWDQADTGGEHPYLERKKISLGSARIKGDLIIIPIFDGGELVSWQTINEDGVKKFPFGGKKKGCYSVLGTINPTQTIFICEGWSTGRSIIEALGTGNVIVALDAGNLSPVAKAIRKMYTNTPIVIAGDNDKNQVGQKAAHAAAKSITNCTVSIPNVIGSDFNDLSHDKIMDILCPKANPAAGINGSPVSVQASGGDWAESLILDSKGRLVSNSLTNAILYLQCHEDLKDVFAYDTFKQTTLIKSCPPWIDENDFEVAPVTDVNITQCASWMERYGLNVGLDRMDKIINTVADNNKFHSAREYFKNLEWDGQLRLETMFYDHFGCESESKEYLAWVATKWMTAAVKRIFEPGCKFDHVLVMESTIQGVSKSGTLKTLVTFGDDQTETYHTDSVSVNDCTSQYTPIKMQGVMIVELAELKGFSKQDDESIKNWITQTTDEVKLPFDRKTTKYKRQFVFAATTNKHDYLKDPTGNRRYWPITIEKIIDLERLAEDRPQLWAEAVYNYKKGLYIGPTAEENAMADTERQKRLFQDAWTDTVLGIVERIGLDAFHTNDIIAKMELKMHDKNDKAVKRVGDILQMNGFENKPKKNPETKKTQRLWVHK